MLCSCVSMLENWSLSELSGGQSRLGWPDNTPSVVRRMVRSCPVLSYAVMCCLSRPIQSCPILSYAVLFCLSRPIQSCLSRRLKLNGYLPETIKKYWKSIISYKCLYSTSDTSDEILSLQTMLSSVNRYKCYSDERGAQFSPELPNVSELHVFDNIERRILK